MFEIFKSEITNKTPTVEELLDKFGREYYFSIKYFPNGAVEIWFGSQREKKAENGGDVSANQPV